MSSAPSKSVSKHSTPTYFPIKEITTWTSRWTIQARVIEKTPMNQFKRVDGQSSKVGNISIMDKKGDSIRAVFWGDAAERWLPVLQDGKIYTFRNGRVQIANRRFNTSPHQYELVFEKDAEIQEVALDDSEHNEKVCAIPMHRKSNITKLREIKNSIRALPFVIDLCVVLSWLAPNAETLTRADGTETLRRNATVRDDTGHEMQLTFWGDSSNIEELNKAYEQRSDDAPVVLIIQNVQIREYRGRTGSIMRSSHIMVNPIDEDEEARDLMTWYSSEGKNAEFESLSEGSSQFSGGAFGGGQPAVLCRLSEAFDKLQLLPVLGPQEPAEFISVIAEPMKLSYALRTGEVTLTFPGCSKCNRKCVGEEGSYRCDNCDINVEQPAEKFRFSVSLVDTSGSRFFVQCFNDQGQVLLGHSADQMKKWIPRNATLSEMALEARQLLEYDILWNRFRFRIRMKKELYMGEERKNVAVVSVERLNFAADARRMLNEIAELLPGFEAQPSRKRPQPPNESTEKHVQEENEQLKAEQRVKRARFNDDNDEHVNPSKIEVEVEERVVKEDHVKVDDQDLGDAQKVE